MNCRLLFRKQLRMKTLMITKGIAGIVFQLDGYLQAVRDLNDDQAGKRYWFWSDMIEIKKELICTIIVKYLNSLSLSASINVSEIREIDLNEELKIIEDNILENYLQGSSNQDDKKQNYVKRLHGWRIQEYISLAANYKKENGRWAISIIDDDQCLTSIFVQIKNSLIVMNFMKKPNSDYLNRTQSR